MPKPIYVICCDSISEDKTTNLLSLFAVLEKVIVVKTAVQSGDDVAAATAIGEQIGRQKATETRVVAVWMKEPGDEDCVFEHEFSFIAPDGKTTSHPPPLQPFGFERSTYLQRFTLTLVGFPVPKETCVVEIQSKVRMHGDEDWLIQSYSLLFEIVEAEPGESVKKSAALESN